MPGIRQAIEHLSKLAETPTDQRHPLVSRALEIDGLDVFTEYYGQLINLSRSGQAAMREIIDGALKSALYKLSLPSPAFAATEVMPWRRATSPSAAAITRGSPSSKARARSLKFHENQRIL